MSFFTAQQHLELLENGQPQNADKDHRPVAKLCIPGTSCIWLLSSMYSAERHIAWGFYNVHGCIPVEGFIDLEQLGSWESLSGPLVQADEFFEAKYPMSVYKAAAKICDRITEKEALLRKCEATRLTIINSISS